jgi:predicted RNA binding protein YcfA (HicA-like mRNA interferase family)
VKSVARFFFLVLTKGSHTIWQEHPLNGIHLIFLPQITLILTDYKIKTVKKSVKSVARFFFLVLTKGSHTIW